MSLHHFWGTEAEQSALPCPSWAPLPLRRERLCSAEGQFRVSFSRQLFSTLRSSELVLLMQLRVCDSPKHPTACLLSERTADNLIKIYFCLGVTARAGPLGTKSRTAGPRVPAGPAARGAPSGSRGKCARRRSRGNGSVPGCGHGGGDAAGPPRLPQPPRLLLWPQHRRGDRGAVRPASGTTPAGEPRLVPVELGREGQMK